MNFEEIRYPRKINETSDRESLDERNRIAENHENGPGQTSLNEPEDASREKLIGMLKEKLRSGEFVLSIKNLISVLTEGGLYHILDTSAITHLRSVVVELESAIADEHSSAKDISRLIRKIGDVISVLGKTSQQKMRFRDYPDSLNKIQAALKDIGEASLRSRLKTEDKEARETSYWLQSLEGLVKNKWGEINRMMEINRRISMM